MSYEVELITKNQLQVSNWSGGTTTQLAIYPKNSLYSERNFKWRLSSAQVLVEESNFTLLPNIKRIIMVLEGNLLLLHNGHHKISLKPFEKDYFSGSWETKSIGKVLDFNVMMTDECNGELKAIHLKKGDIRLISIPYEEHKENVQALYCFKGNVIIDIFNTQYHLSDGELILITSKKINYHIKLHSEEDSQIDIIHTSISY